MRTRRLIPSRSYQSKTPERLTPMRRLRALTLFVSGRWVGSHCTMLAYIVAHSMAARISASESQRVRKTSLRTQVS